MTINQICQTMKNHVSTFTNTGKTEMAKVALHHFTYYTDAICKDNTMKDYYYPRMDGYIEALFFADALTEPEYEIMTDLMIQLHIA